MFDKRKTGNFIIDRRRELGMTQRQLADKLSISFQSVSKWENGIAYPSISILYNLAIALDVTVDEILLGSKKETEGQLYRISGIDASYEKKLKREIAKCLETNDFRLLNRVDATASLYDIEFPEIRELVLVLKSDGLGAKQKLAAEYGFTESICYDLINRLVNDIVIMGAKPLAVLDTIICGKAEISTIKNLVKAMSEACKLNECSLVGGKTLIQPSIVNSGNYILTSSAMGIVERTKIIDGSTIEKGDSVLAIVSNGLHTNGYSLIHSLLEKKPSMQEDKINGLSFIEQIMKPHISYYAALKDLLDQDVIHGMAHITGGGIEYNLNQIVPEGLCAIIDLSQIRVLDIFKYIHINGNINDNEMLHIFNCGVGVILVVAPVHKEYVINYIKNFYACYEIGLIMDKGNSKVTFKGRINWL